VSDVCRIIQKQVPIGSRVSFGLKNGGVVSGTLVELGREHVTVETDSGFSSVLIDMIGGWQVLSDMPGQKENIVSAPDNETYTTSLGEIKRPTSTEKPVISIESPTPEVLKKLLEIEARFQARTQAAAIQLRRPDFVFPAEELKGKHSANASVIWNRVKDKYLYAEKINELSAKFGRIQPLANELTLLSEQFPGSVVVKRHLAYFHHLLGNRREALDFYTNAALTSKDACDWYNLAAQALTAMPLT